MVDLRNPRYRPILSRLEYIIDPLLDGCVCFVEFLFAVGDYLEGTNPGSRSFPGKPGRKGCPVEGDIKAYIDELVARTDERIDRRFNERASRLEGENSMFKDMLERKEGEVSALSSQLEASRMELDTYRSLQTEKDEKNTEAFRRTDEELARLREENSGLSECKRILQEDKAEAIRQLGEMEREMGDLRKAATFRYGFDILIPIIETGLYSVMGNKESVYAIAAWLQRANEAGIEKDYMCRILEALKEGKAVHKNPRNKAFKAMLGGDPSSALDILREHNFPISQ